MSRKGSPPTASIVGDLTKHTHQDAKYTPLPNLISRTIGNRLSRSSSPVTHPRQYSTQDPMRGYPVYTGSDTRSVVRRFHPQAAEEEGKETHVSETATYHKMRSERERGKKKLSNDKRVKRTGSAWYWPHPPRSKHEMGDK